MKHLVAISALALWLGGCAAQRQAAALQEQSAETERLTAYAAENCKPVPNHVASAKCVNRIWDERVQREDPQDIDLQYLLDAYRIKYASEIDAGRMAIEDANLAIAQRLTEVKQIAIQRQQGQQIVAAQQQQAMAAQLSATTESTALALDALRPVPAAPIYATPRSTQTNCHAVPGGGVNCSSW